MSEAVRPFGVDLDRLGRWLDEAGIARGAARDPVRLKGGTQNLMLRFSCGGENLVLRRPPPDRGKPGEVVRREAVVLSALAGTEVPHPRFRGACMEPEIAGGAFLVTDAVEGFTATVEMPGAASTDAALQRRMGLTMLDGLAALAAVPIAGELAGLGRTEGFLARQRERWAKQLEGYAAFKDWSGPAALGAVKAVADWLDAHVPDEFQPGLMHGDFHIANVMFRRETGELAAILDWELATLGDPLLDLGRLLTVWPDRDGTTLLSQKVRPWFGFPTAEELAERYAAKTGRSLKSLTWFKVLACYKYAIILEGTNARASAGLADADTAARLHKSATGMMRLAAGLAEAA